LPSVAIEPNGLSVIVIVAVVCFQPISRRS
jgi:hypothetical protein